MQSGRSRPPNRSAAEQPAVDDDAAADAALHHQEQRHARTPLVAPVGLADGECVGIVLGNHRNPDRQGVSHQLGQINVLASREAAPAGRARACPSAPEPRRQSLRIAQFDGGMDWRASLPPDRLRLDADRRPSNGSTFVETMSVPRSIATVLICSTPISTPKKEYGVRHQFQHDAGTTGPCIAWLPGRILDCFAHQTVSRQAGDDIPDEERLRRNLRASSARLRRPN